jgi:two-component system OmpR family sensor kinase
LSLRLRLLIAAGLLVLALTATGYSLIATVEHSQIQQIDDQLRATVPIAAGLARDSSATKSGATSPDGRARAQSDTYVAVISGTNRQVLASPQSAKGEQPALPSTVTVSASTLRAETVGSVQGSTQWRTVLLRIPGGKEVLVGIDTASIDATASDLRVAVIAAGLTVALILLASGFWVERLGLRPLAQMKEVADDVIRGDRSRRAAEPAAPAEAAQLAKAFNLMLDQQNVIEDQLRQFVADASHELRTPTAVISGLTELWRQGELRDGDEFDDAMRRIGQAAHRMRALVEELLLLARLDEGMPAQSEVVDLGDMMRSIGTEAGSIFPSRPVSFEIDEPLLVQADPVGLRRAISNLVMNALVHTPEASWVAVRAGARDGSVWLDVADEGPGMEPADAQHAFDRFWRGTASRTRPGTGLGLSIVSAIVGVHDGTVTLDTSPAAGTTVHVVIPAQEPTH